MSDPKPFSWLKRALSFRYAFEGMLGFFRSEHNAILHLVATVIVIVLAFVFRVTRMEIIILSIAVTSVWAAELFNTAIEKIMDFLAPEQLPQVKLIKDLAAAAVLVTAIGALVAGCLIFIPYLF